MASGKPNTIKISSQWRKLSIVVSSGKASARLPENGKAVGMLSNSYRGSSACFLGYLPIRIIEPIALNSHGYEQHVLYYTDSVSAERKVHCLSLIGCMPLSPSCFSCYSRLIILKEAVFSIISNSIIGIRSPYIT